MVDFGFQHLRGSYLRILDYFFMGVVGFMNSCLLSSYRLRPINLSISYMKYINKGVYDELSSLESYNQYECIVEMKILSY